MPYLVNATFPSSRPAPPKKPIDSWVLSLLSAMYFTNLNPNAPCMEYLPTVYIYIYVPQICGKPIGNYSLHGASLGKGFCGALTARPHPSTQQPNNRPREGLLRTTKENGYILSRQTVAPKNPTHGGHQGNSLQKQTVSNEKTSALWHTSVSLSTKVATIWRRYAI